MKTPPIHGKKVFIYSNYIIKKLIEIFLFFCIKGGKKCPSCGQRVYHDKWGLSDRLAEARWAHQEARMRELAEVEDFFN